MALTRRHLLHSALYTMAALPITGCFTVKQPSIMLPAGCRVLAVGDSLTFGTGAQPQDSYPYVLANITGWEVINAGIPGDTSNGLLKRLPWLLKKYNPHLVLTCIGINDFMLGKPVEEVKGHVKNICHMIENSRTQQMLISVPHMVQSVISEQKQLQNASLYTEIASELGILLQQNALLHMITTPAMLADFVHGNAKGYTYLAHEIAASLHHAGILNKRPEMPHINV